MLDVATPAAAQARRPERVVVVLLDDVGVDKVAAYGLHPTAGPTPVLDALARQGVLFSNAYADPLCSPTRCAALTGLYGSRTGIGTGVQHYGPEPGAFAPSDELPWLPRLLARAGLRSTAVGKWHLTHVDVPAYQQHPIRAGFSRFAGALANLSGVQSYNSWVRTYADGFSYGESTSTTYATLQQAFDGLESLRGPARFTWLAFNAPHAPWNQPPAGYFTPVGSLPPPPKQQQMVLEATDTILGMLLEAWAAESPVEASRTLWIVMGDNGTPAAAIEPPFSSLHSKSTVYQGGVHVPLIVFGAGVDEPGRTCDQLVHAVDLWATVLELLGVQPPPGPTDSRSFAPVLWDAGAPPARESVYVRTHAPNGFGPYNSRSQAATDGRWKLIEASTQSGGSAFELYDLSADPLEAANLWPPDTGPERAAAADLEAVLQAGDQSSPQP
ncbi:MAG TPA: sulfatase-like hydrolase/transferase [Planctomycetota bacterium]|nr:sulfatase-like hydrolase/transferase [Planctomycetota bacterium]